MISSPVDLGQANNISGATLVLTLGVSVPPGALIIVAVCDRSTGAGAGTLADSKSNSWQSVQQNMNGVPNGDGYCFFAYNCIGMSAGDTITFTKLVSGDRAALSAFYVTGADITNPLDISTTAAVVGGGSQPTITSGVPFVANELFVGLLFDRGNGGTFTQGAGFATPPIQSTSGGTGPDGRTDGGTAIQTTPLAMTYAPTVGTVTAGAIMLLSFRPYPNTNRATPVSSARSFPNDQPRVFPIT